MVSVAGRGQREAGEQQWRGGAPAGRWLRPRRYLLKEGEAVGVSLGGGDAARAGPGGAEVRLGLRGLLRIQVQGVNVKAHRGHFHMSLWGGASRGRGGAGAGGRHGNQVNNGRRERRQRKRWKERRKSRGKGKVKTERMWTRDDSGRGRGMHRKRGRAGGGEERHGSGSVKYRYIPRY